MATGQPGQSSSDAATGVSSNKLESFLDVFAELSKLGFTIQPPIAAPAGGVLAVTDGSAHQAGSKPQEHTQQPPTHGDHPLDDGKLSHLISGLYAAGHAGTKPVEDVFRVLRKMEGSFQGAKKTKFRALITTIKSTEERRDATALRALKKVKKRKHEAQKRLMRERMLKMGWGCYEHDEAFFTKQEDCKEKAENLDESAQKNLIELSDACTVGSASVTLSSADFEKPLQGLKELLKLQGKSHFPPSFYEFAEDKPKGWETIAKIVDEVKQPKKPHTVKCTDADMLKSDSLLRAWSRMLKLGLRPETQMFGNRLLDAVWIGGMGKLVPGECIVTDQDEAYLVTWSCIYGSTGMLLSRHETQKDLYMVNGQRMMERIEEDASRCEFATWSCLFQENRLWIKIENKFNFLKTMAYRSPSMVALRQIARIKGVTLHTKSMMEAAKELFDYTDRQLVAFQTAGQKRLAVKLVKDSTMPADDVPGEQADDEELLTNDPSCRIEYRLNGVMGDEFVKTAYMAMETDERGEFDVLHQKALAGTLNKNAKFAKERTPWTRLGESSRYLYIYTNVAARCYTGYHRQPSWPNCRTKYRAWGGTLMRTQAQARMMIIEWVMQERRNLQAMEAEEGKTKGDSDTSKRNKVDTGVQPKTDAQSKTSAASAAGVPGNVAESSGPKPEAGNVAESSGPKPAVVPESKKQRAVQSLARDVQQPMSKGDHAEPVANSQTRFSKFPRIPNSNIGPEPNDKDDRREQPDSVAASMQGSSTDAEPALCLSDPAGKLCLVEVTQNLNRCVFKKTKAKTKGRKPRESKKAEAPPKTSTQTDKYLASASGEGAQQTKPKRKYTRKQKLSERSAEAAATQPTLQKLLLKAGRHDAEN